MAGLEELKKKLTPLFDADKGFSPLDVGDSDMMSDSGTINLLSRSYGVYNINELGLQKCSTSSSPVDETNHSEKTYRCGSNEMRIFGTIGSGASSIVQRAIHIPTHRIIALKKINIFEKDKLALLWSTWMVDRWQISYGFRGVCQKQFCLVVRKLLHCATFIGTVTDMSPERIRNESYSYAADIWSLCLALFECGTGEFPYSAIDGPINLMLQILDDPSPSPSKEKFSPEFCSFIDACRQKVPDARPTAKQASPSSIFS